jgi:hypothetical protein
VDPGAAHALWREGRDRLMCSHPQSPLPAADPMRAGGVPYWPYDPALRWTDHTGTEVLGQLGNQRVRRAVQRQRP